MSLELLGRKVGMTQIFSEAGDRVPVTVVELGPCTVIQKKTRESDGYDAVQLGFEERKQTRTSKPLAGHFARAGVSPRRVLYEVRLSTEELGELTLGQEIACGDTFEVGQQVDVMGTTKGRGFTGVVKRWNFKTHRATHGTHEHFRHGGALSAGTYPGRILPGKKMAGHSGAARRTVRGLRVEKIDADRNLLFIRGAVPGHRAGLVRVRRAVRG